MTTAVQNDIRSWLLESIKPDEFTEKDFKLTGIRFEALVPQARIQEVARGYLSRGYFLESQTAVDFAECLEVVYHFNRWKTTERSCVKILVPKNEGKPGDGSWSAPSVSSVYQGAIWFEREIF